MMLLQLRFAIVRPFSTAGFLSCLLVTLFGWRSAASVPPQNFDDYITKRCLIGNSVPCNLFVTEAIAFSLRGTERLPNTVHVHFTAKGAWILYGGTIDFAGAIIDALPDAQIFGGTGTITGLAYTRPEWFAQPIGEVYPAVALALAYRATLNWGSILLRDRSYISPFFDPNGAEPCGGTTVLFELPRTIVGTKRPVPDSMLSPHQLVHGSTILGEICSNGVLRMSHVGIDEGDLINGQWFHGKGFYGIAAGSSGGEGLVRGSALDDVSVLTGGLENQHSVIFENQRDVSIRHLWIWTKGGTHGLVIKSKDTLVDDFHCAGASADCLILKSDYDTDHAGEASGSRVQNVYIRYLNSPGDTGGIVLDARWDSMHNLNLEGVHENGVAYGLVAMDSLVHQLTNVTVTGWEVDEAVGPCLLLNGSRQFSIQYFSCHRDPPSHGAAFIMSGRDAHLGHGTIQCDSDAHNTCEVDGDGVVDWGRGSDIKDVKGIGLGGYLLRTSPRDRNTLRAGLDATRMGGRTTAERRGSAPFPERYAVKPYLRIAWTKFAVNLRDSSARQRLAACFLLLFALVVAVLLRVPRLGRRRIS